MSPHNDQVLETGVTKIKETLAWIADNTEAENGDGGAYCVVGIHTPEMQPNGMYVWGSGGYTSSMQISAHLAAAFGGLHEEEVDSIVNRGFERKYAQSLSVLGDYNDHMPEDSLPARVWAAFVTAVLEAQAQDTDEVSGVCAPDAVAAICSMLEEIVANVHADEAALAAFSEITEVDGD